MALDEGSDLGHGVVRDVVDRDDGVRVAHVHRRQSDGPGTDLEGDVDRPARAAVHGDLPAFEPWAAHVDRGAVDASVAAELDGDREHAGAGLDADDVAGGESVVPDVLGHAAHAVAAHLGLAAVGIEHPHAGVGDFRGADEDQSVRADPEVAVGDLAGDPGGVVDLLAEEVDVDVVVPQAFHLGEAHPATRPRRTGTGASG